MNYFMNKTSCRNIKYGLFFLLFNKVKVKIKNSESGFIEYLLFIIYIYIYIYILFNCKKTLIEVN